MRWVKASERHADLGMNVNLKIDGRPGFGKFYKGADGINLGFEATNGFGTLYNYQLQNVFWLDETEQPASEDELYEQELLWREIFLLCGHQILFSKVQQLKHLFTIQRRK